MKWKVIFIEFGDYSIGSDLTRVVVDRCYPLEQAAEAHMYVESGQKMGNVVITVAPDVIN